MDLKIISAAFFTSLALHGAGGVFVGSGGWPVSGTAQPEPVMISYVQPAIEARIESRQPIVKTAQAPQKQYLVEVAPLPKPLAPSQARPRTAGLRAHPKRVQAAQKRVIPAVPKTGADFLTDPQTGRIFVSYFGVVKEKIQKTIKRKYARRQTTSGNVSVYFVLDPMGRVVKSAVSDKESSASEGLKAFALECLTASSSFGPFPKPLGGTNISFTVNILFDEI
ncbi:MAG: energy transducer TonB [Candidatus Omnitrophota bacterium]